MLRFWLLAVLGLLTTASFGRTQPGSELGRVPKDVLGVFHFQAGTIYSSPAMKEARDLIAKAGPRAMSLFEERFQPGPHQLERITGVILAPNGPSGEPDFAIMISSKVDILAKGLPERIGLEGKPVEGSGFPFWVEAGQRTKSMAIALPEPRLVVLGEKDLVEKICKAPATPPSAQLQEMGKHHLAIQVNLSQVPDQLKQNVPPPLAFLKGATDLSLTVDLETLAEIKAKLSFVDKPGAEMAHTQVLELAKVALGQLDEPRQKMLAQLEKPGFSPFSEMPEALAAFAGLAAINHAEEFLKNPPVKVAGNQLVAEMKTPQGIPPAFLALSMLGVSATAPAVAPARKAAARMQAANNLKQIGLAFHNYHDAMGKFPTDIFDPKTGKPLLSWRVAILPYIEQDALYRQFKLDEPWDSENNRKLVKFLVPVYTDPTQEKKTNEEGQGLTHYQVFTGKKTLFDGNRASRLQTITDGTSNTILAVEAKEGVVWTKPGGITLDLEKDLPAVDSLVGINKANGFQALFCDGSVRFIKITIDPKIMKWLIMPADGNPIPELP